MIKTVHQPFLPRSISTDSCNKTTPDQILIKHSVSYEEVDNPNLKGPRLPFNTEEELIRAMKYERNRLLSFHDVWPLRGIKPESLAEAGLFYLQEGDKVQCPFCSVILHSWTPVDKPLIEHMIRSPKCPFLTASPDCGNVPLLKQKETKKVSSCTAKSPAAHVNYKPKRPDLSDVKRRLLSFAGWPKVHPKPEALAECGFYYTGVDDVVTCFFCGYSLGRWGPTDDPWEEHEKFFKDCGFLAVSASHRPPKVHKPPETQPLVHMNFIKKSFTFDVQERGPDITSDIHQEALHIFPKHLVQDAMKNNKGSMRSLQELCNIILNSQNSKNQSALHVKEDQAATSSSSANGQSSSSDALLCKFCVDEVRNAVFLPCLHQEACHLCARRFRDCPVCRRPIENVIRTYL